MTLTATPATGYSTAQWGGACASAGSTADCTLAMTANQAVTVSFLKALTVASLSVPREVGGRVQVKLKLSRTAAPGEAKVVCRATAGLKLIAHTISGAVATCAWSVPARLHGRRVTGNVTVTTDSGGRSLVPGR